MRMNISEEISFPVMPCGSFNGATGSTSGNARRDRATAFSQAGSAAFRASQERR